MIGIDEGHERRGLGGQGRELIPCPLLAGSLPGRAALLHEPEAADILEQARGAADAGFVREVAREAFGCDERARKLGAYECPRAKAHIAPVWSSSGRLVGRHRCDGACCVVRAGDDHANPAQTSVGGDIGAQHTKG